MAPDGGLELEPAEPLDDPPPRLCEAGPCRHYHRMAVQMDAQNPMAERRDGQLVRHARVFHTTVSHYCYPDVGIETNLGSLPVLECNRWVPIKSLLTMTRTIRARHERELAEWHDARKLEADVAAAESGEITEPIMVYLATFDGTTLDQRHVPIAGDATIAQIVDGTVFAARMFTDQSTWRARGFVVELDGEPLTNHNATVSQLGIETGAKLTIFIKESV